MPREAQALERLLAAAPDEVLAELGVALLGEGLGFGPGDPSRSARFAESWLGERWSLIRSMVCGDEFLCAALDDGTRASVQSIDLLATRLEKIAGEAAADLVAVALLQRGRSAICG